MTATQLSPGSVRKTAAGATAPGRRRALDRYLNPALGVLGVAVVLAAWQICASTGVVDPKFSSSPSGAFRALVDSFTSGDVWSPLGSTLSIVAWGMLISIVAAIPLGLLIGRNRVLYALTDPLISIMYSVPYVVFLPMLIFWFGIGADARVVIVVWSAMFPLLINVIAGARNLEQSHLQVSRVFCASRLTTLRSVAFPATLPYILAGVRQAVGRALIGAIVAELFMGSAGLGYVVQLKTSNFQTDDAMAAIAVIAIIAVLLNHGVAYLEQRLTFWSRTD
ncbi:ABC transporter permease [Actinacidiphila guanduensis]|uniref:NitT/TauT family transport system permease protein n=1 Tax=Actinacidiphila guanduensis TaxID=310781 RepID=A0A1H0QQ06_9ACTN|nr:ABC transporter permease [Actinacidiphila guanduensis]SDP19424.1 NitT/TauT family transport system permease protein [Actinacidiphila guanduensis]